MSKMVGKNVMKEIRDASAARGRIARNAGKNEF